MQLTDKLKKSFIVLHHLGYVIFILFSFIIPIFIEKVLNIGLKRDYYIYLFLIDALSCFLLVPSNYIDVYENKNNLKFYFGKSNPTAKLGYALFFAIIFLLLFFFCLFDRNLKN